jgi:endonuclease YncB( thermonuclease family)
MGLLEVHGTLTANQFWPLGTSDADTLRVALREKEALVFQGAPTQAFGGARVGNRPVLTARGELTVRLQGIDAPELHYRPGFVDRSAEEMRQLAQRNGQFRQPLGEAAAAALGALVASAARGAVRCVVRTHITKPGDAFDMYGRLIGDVFIRPGHAEVNLNHWLVQHGWAFPAFYNSMTRAEIDAIASLSREAETAELGVWAHPLADVRDFSFKRVFRAGDDARASEPGPVCFPKLFRRVAAWRVLTAAALSADGFGAFLKERPDPCYETADFLARRSGLRMPAGSRRTLDAYVTPSGRFKAAPEGLVFVEGASVLRDEAGKVIVDW